MAIKTQARLDIEIFEALAKNSKTEVDRIYWAGVLRQRHTQLNKLLRVGHGEKRQIKKQG
jgi:hypothetical protein